MKISFFKNLSDVCELVEVKSGISIKDAMPYVDFKKTQIMVNGQFSTENHIIRDTDLIAVRTIPFASWTALDWALLIFTGGIGNTIKSGIEAYQAKEEAQKALDDIKSLQKTDRNAITNQPTYRGAKNTKSTGKTQPYIIGRNLFTPYIMNDAGNNYAGVHSIAGIHGVKEYYNVVLETGFKDQVLDKVYCGNQIVKSFISNKTIPTSGKFLFDPNSPFDTQDSFIEVAQNGYKFKNARFINKVVERIQNIEVLKHKRTDDDIKDLFFTLEKNTMSMDVIIMFNGLFAYSDKGTRGKTKRTIIPSYSYDYAQLLAEGGDVSTAHWVDFSFRKGETIVDKVLHKTDYILNVPPVDGSDSQEYWEFYNNQKGWALEHRSQWQKVVGGDDYDYSDAASMQVQYMSLYDQMFISLEEWEVSEPREYWTDTTEFEGDFAEQIRYAGHVDFNFNDVINLRYPITLRVSTPDKEPEEGTEYNSCYVQYVQSHIYNKKRSISGFVPEKIIEDKESQLSCAIGLCIESTKENENQTDSFQVETCSMAPVWKDGSNIRETTSNPASWVYEVLTSDCHTPSKIDESILDTDAFIAWYDYCEENQLYCNFVITQGMSKKTILDMICSCGHATLYRNAFGQLSVAIDGLKDNAIAVFNEQNIVSLSYQKENKRKIDGVKVTYLRSDDWTEDSFILMYDGSDPDERSSDSVIVNLDLQGITTYEQAVKEAYYRMKCEKLRPKKCNVEIGNEGYFITPLSKVLLQHPALKIGLGSAEIKKINYNWDATFILGFELYEPVTLNETDSFYVTVQCVGTMNDRGYCYPQTYAIEGNDGRTTEINLKTAIAVADNKILPNEGNILSYGYGAESITSEMLVSSITPSDNGFAMELVNYDSRIVDFSETIPAYTPNLTQPIPAPVPSIPNVTNDAETISASSLYTDYVGQKSSIVDSTTYYAGSTSGTSAPAGYETAPNEKWTVDVPRVLPGQYLWSCSTTTYGDGHKNYSFMASRQGENGQTAGMDTMILSQYVIKKTPSGSYSPSTLEASRLHFNEEGSNVVTPAIFKLYVNGNYKETQTTTNEKLEATFNYIKYLERGESLNMLKVEMYESQAVARDVERFITQYALPVVSDGENYTFGLKNQFQQYICDTEGNVQNHVLKTSAFIFKGFEEITDWEFYDLPYEEARKNGFELSVNGKELTITSLEGKTMPESGSLRFPLFVHSTADDRKIIGNPLTGTIIGNYNKGYVLGRIAPGETTNVFSVYFSWQKTTIDKRIVAKSTPKALGVVTSITEFPASAGYGDYVLYVGDDIGEFKKLSCYQWDGLNWVLDTDNIHVTSYLSEALEYLGENDSESDSFKFINNLFANQVTARKIGTQHLTLSEGGIIDCVAKDKDGNPMIMLKDTGEAYFRRAIINGYPRNEDVFVEGTTEIDGGKIKTESIKAAQIDVENLFAQNITATGNIQATNMRLSGNSEIEGKVRANQFEIHINEEPNSRYPFLYTTDQKSEEYGVNGKVDSRLNRGFKCVASGRIGLWINATVGDSNSNLLGEFSIRRTPAGIQPSGYDDVIFKQVFDSFITRPTDINVPYIVLDVDVGDLIYLSAEFKGTTNSQNHISVNYTMSVFADQYTYKTLSALTSYGNL